MRLREHLLRLVMVRVLHAATSRFAPASGEERVDVLAGVGEVLLPVLFAVRLTIIPGQGDCTSSRIG